jgi:Flp pilus assembly protein TadD
MNKYSKRRRSRKPMYFGNFYLNPSFQYMATIISAIALAGFVFSGFLLFRFTDEEDLINRGKLQLMEGKIAWASKTFAMLLNSHPKSYEGHLLMGEAYRQLGERAKAEQEFLTAAALKTSKLDHAPEIALSKVAITRGDFAQAEQRLLTVWRKNRQNQDAREALCSLYEAWGNTLKDKSPPDAYALVIEKYALALQYVTEVNMQQLIEKKQLETIYAYSGYLKDKKQYTEAIHQLKLSLRLKYKPETLIQIAATYQKMDDLDGALEWYRKAFQLNPNTVGLQFANSLIKKANALKTNNKGDEAQAFYQEADRVGQQAKIPMEELYPVDISHVSITYKLDRVTGEFSPKVIVNMSNNSGRELTFLRMKTEFFSGDQLISKSTQRIAMPEADETGDSKTGKKAKKEKGQDTVVFRGNKVSVTFEPEHPIHTNAIYGGKMTVKVSISYDEKSDDEALWKLKSIQHATINMAPEPEEEDTTEENTDR